MVFNSLEQNWIELRSGSVTVTRILHIILQKAAGGSKFLCSISSCSSPTKPPPVCRRLSSTSPLKSSGQPALSSFDWRLAGILQQPSGRSRSYHPKPQRARTTEFELGTPKRTLGEVPFLRTVWIQTLVEKTVVNICEWNAASHKRCCRVLGNTMCTTTRAGEKERERDVYDRNHKRNKN